MVDVATRPQRRVLETKGARLLFHFKFYTSYQHLKVHVILKRTHDKHTGHDLEIDKHVNPVDSMLITEIKEWVKLGVTLPDMITSTCPQMGPGTWP